MFAGGDGGAKLSQLIDLHIKTPATWDV